MSAKYGGDHVRICQDDAGEGKIGTGRVMNIPYGDVDRVAKLVPDTLKITLDEAVNQEPRLKEAVKTDPKIAEVFETARVLEGLTRHASKHAAGVVISEEPLTNYTPLYRDTNGEIVTQYAKDEIEKIGLVKFDFLGLRTLTVMTTR
jgi:DNA polymerase-3 subunit alpha